MLQVNTETWVKENQAENEAVALKWAWRPENVDDTVVKGKGEKTVCRLIDQKVANDASDYLWYMTRYVYTSPYILVHLNK